MRIVLASGYPRSVVPNVENKDLASAQSQLVATHLRYRIVYRLAQGVPTNQVLHEIPAAGTSVYQGTRVRLTVSRTLRWVRGARFGNASRKYACTSWPIVGLSGPVLRSCSVMVMTLLCLPVCTC